MCNTNKPEAPKGYRHKNGGEHRLPKRGEYYLDSNLVGGVGQAQNGDVIGWCWILEPIPKPDLTEMKYVKYPEYVEMTVKLPLPDEGKEWRQFQDAQHVFEQRPIKKYLDWSKVGPDVLAVTNTGNIQPTRYPTLERFDRVFEGWQAHLGGECPVDPEACMVEVRHWDHDKESGLAKNFKWTAVVHYRVTGLAENYYYP